MIRATHGEQQVEAVPPQIDIDLVGNHAARRCRIGDEREHRAHKARPETQCRSIRAPHCAHRRSRRPMRRTRHCHDRRGNLLAHGTSSDGQQRRARRSSLRSRLVAHSFNINSNFGLNLTADFDGVSRQCRRQPGAIDGVDRALKSSEEMAQDCHVPPGPISLTDAANRVAALGLDCRPSRPRTPKAWDLESLG